MTTVRDIARIMEEYAPKSLAEKWDNVGLLAGSYKSEVKSVLVALDLDNECICEAIDLQADIIITHHPILLQPISSITDETVTGKHLLRLIQHNIAMFAAHTNLDTADGGVNDILAQRLGLFNVNKLYCPDFDGSARMGEVKEQAFGAFAEFVRSRLNSKVIKCVGDKQRIIRTAGVCGGSAGFMIDGAIRSGCDVLVVGEAKYSDEQKAAQLGIGLIEAGHFETETLVCEAIRQRLQQAFKDIQINVSKRKTTYYE